ADDIPRRASSPRGCDRPLWRTVRWRAVECVWPEVQSVSERFERVVEFTAGDGLKCNVINVRGAREPSKGPVLLVHGAGVRANIFRAPSERNLVDLLVEEGWDVWLENWRASIDIPHNH